MKKTIVLKKDNKKTMVQNQEEMTNGRQMGFAKAWTLGIITSLVTIGIIFKEL